MLRERSSWPEEGEVLLFILWEMAVCTLVSVRGGNQWLSTLGDMVIYMRIILPSGKEIRSCLCNHAGLLNNLEFSWGENNEYEF